MKPIHTVIPDFTTTALPFMVREIVRPTFATDFHFHQECQLVWVKSGRGTRVIGNSIEQFEEGDLTFVGANVPHVWYSEATKGDEARSCSLALFIHPETVLRQLSGLVDTQPLAYFFSQAERGFSVSGPTRERLCATLTRMRTEMGLALLRSFIEVMDELLQTTDRHWLNDAMVPAAYASRGQQRIVRLMQYIRENFRKEISVESAASVAGLQLHAFCRYFKALTHRTFSDFLNEMRVGHACQLLQQSDLPITQVAYECGYTNISYFNRSFRRIKNATPKAYRQQIAHLNINLPADTESRTSPAAGTARTA